VAGAAQTARWNEAWAKLDVVLKPQVDMTTFFNSAKATLLADGGTAAAWEHFSSASEWPRHYAGLRSVGYLEPVAQPTGETTLRLKFFKWRNPTAGQPAYDPTADAVVAGGLNDWYNHSNGWGSFQLSLPLADSDRLQDRRLCFVTLRNNHGFITEHDRLLPRPSAVLFFELDHVEYFRSYEKQLAGLPVELKLLAPEEPDPPHTANRRPFSLNAISGGWRFDAILKPSPTEIILPPWLLLGGGLVLSGIFSWLFARQTRLRYQAEAARELVLAREAEILALNRDLEQKISGRTAELKVALAEEKELNRLKTNFTSMVTHEIRTPLEIILSSADILLRYLDRLQPERRTAHLLGIKSAVQRMNALMADVLLFSRAEAGRMEFNPAALDLGGLGHKLVDEIQSATNQRCPIRLAVNDVSEPARADENLLRHILTNLLSNAVKYSPAGKAVLFSVIRVAGDAVITIQDSGMGIPDEDRQRIFTPFYRGKNVATIQGTGLGLVIVKHCVEQHGGTISIESGAGGGTKVTVRLPLFSPAHTEFLNRIGEKQKPE
jgi:signal transduction histidine kinase